MNPQGTAVRNPIVILLLAVLLAGPGCSRTLDVQGDDLERALSALAQAGYEARQDGVLPAPSGDLAARKRALREVLIEPLRHLGFDPDRSIQHLESEYQAGLVPDDRRDLVAGFLETYRASTPDLEQFNLIAPETAAALRQN